MAITTVTAVLAPESGACLPTEKSKHKQYHAPNPVRNYSPMSHCFLNQCLYSSHSLPLFFPFSNVSVDVEEVAGKKNWPGREKEVHVPVLIFLPTSGSCWISHLTSLALRFLRDWETESDQVTAECHLSVLLCNGCPAVQNHIVWCGCAWWLVPKSAASMSRTITRSELSSLNQNASTHLCLQ